MAAELESVGGGGTVRPLDWPRRIKEVLGRDLHVLCGQRIVDVRTGATMRHELFPRVVAGDELILASEFVRTPEENSSIGEIDRWVVARAIEMAAAGNRVHVNLTLGPIDDAMLELIGERFELTGAEAGVLVLELSERQLIAAPDQCRDFMRDAIILGCRIAVNDFVEGGPEALLLRDVPIDYVKLGSEFMKNLETDPARRRAVSGAALTAHRRGQRLIAQGVERVTTLQLLSDLGVDEAQGSVLGAPEPLESLLGIPA